MQSSPRTVAVGVDLGSATTTVSTRRDGGSEPPDVRQSATALSDGTGTRHSDEPALIGLAVPATWSPTRRRAHAEAAANAGFDASFLVSEPEAAARHFAAVQGHRLDPGAPLVVCNLGAGSCHVAVVRREGERYQIEAATTADDIGGRAFDRLLLGHLSERLRRTDAEYLARVQNPGETALCAGALDAVRRARERLSEHHSATVALPGLDRELRLTREDADHCLTPAVLRTVSLIEDAMREAGVETGQVAALLLVGGASRTPLVADVLRHHFGVELVRPDLPDLVIAEGAALAGLARIGGDGRSATPAAVGLARMRTSPEVLVTILVVVIAVLSFAGVALLNRGGPEVQGLDAATETPTLPGGTGASEAAEPSGEGTREESGGEPAPADSSDPEAAEDATAAAESDAPLNESPSSLDPTTGAASPVGQADATVPDVVGESLADAERILAEAGFTAVASEGVRRTGNGSDHCDVTAQSPESGTEQSPDDTVTLTYTYVGTDNC
ncbi:Hsp70 family protein [Glycomyces albidus]|uniref:Hsp70 family protein n=1 Tax=Glycomyces albidus TaxID=2656774 RepID=A0A6L5GDX7_9ACTN|nr:Hsp70 family protein [Glycomyces albidus]MQM27897.1 Hsp70 family protein [Glycomyces albidus]